jgi:hypothetical protein
MADTPQSPGPGNPPSRPAPRVAPAAPGPDVQSLTQDAAKIMRLMSGFARDLGSVATAIGKHVKGLSDANAVTEKHEKKKQKLDAAEIDRIERRLKALKETDEKHEKLERKQEELLKLKNEIQRTSSKQLKEQVELANNSIKARKQQAAKHIAHARQLEKVIEESTNLDQKRLAQKKKELEKAKESAKKLLDPLDKLDEKVTLINGELAKELTAKKVATKAHETLKKKTLELASAFTAGRAAALAWQAAVRQSSTGETSSGWEFLRNQTRQMLSGISSEVYDTALSQTRSTKLAAGENVQDRLIGAGTSGFFAYTGSRNESAKATAELIPALQAAGIRSVEMGDAMSGLIPQFGRLSAVTGKSVTELSAMTGELLKERDTRMMLHGLNSDQRLAAIQELNLAKEKLVMDGYTLEQAREIQREQIRARMGGTLRSRVREVAQTQQNLQLLINATDDPKAKADLRQLLVEYVNAQMNAASSAGKTPEQMKKAKDEFERKSTEVGTTLASGVGTLTERYGYVDQRLASINRISETMGEMGARGWSSGPKMGEAATRGVGDTGGLFGGGVGAVVSGIQSVTNALKGPLLTGVISLAALGATQVRFLAVIAARLTGGRVGGWTTGMFDKAGAAGKGVAGKVKGATGTIGGLAGKVGIPKGIAPTALLGLGATMAGGYLADQGHEKTGAGLGIAGQAATFAGTGAMLGSILPGVGTAIGAGLGGVLGAGYGLYDNWGTIFGKNSSTTPPRASTPSTPSASTPPSAIVTKNAPTSSSSGATTELMQIASILTKIYDTLSTDVSTRQTIRKEVDYEINKLRSIATVNGAGFSGNRFLTTG